MTEIAVAVVDAETPGNIGTIARAMRNFGFSTLLLVDPPALDPDGEAYGFAGKAREDVLPNHQVTTFDDLVEKYHTIGFTAITNESGNKHVRYPFSTPTELPQRVETAGRPIALVFGRERVGLTNDELARIDELCSIPAAADYPTLNLGQAATIALYELSGTVLPETQLPDRDADRATPDELEGFFDHVSSFLEELNYPEEKRDKTIRLIRRVFGRADPTGRELKTLRGVMRRASRMANRRDQ
jgi:TrmH family RNA methyltransferase